jgi:hypothetical protein
MKKRDGIFDPEVEIYFRLATIFSKSFSAFSISARDIMGVMETSASLSSRNGLDGERHLVGYEMSYTILVR